MKARFYENGLKFECTGCGKCCEYSDAAVYLDKNDIHRIGNALTMSRSSFVRTFCIEDGQRTILRSTGSRCIFLKNDRCTIYSCRPDQCRTFPFWPEILKSKVRWDYVAGTCEGMNSGRKYTAEEIRLVLRSGIEVPGTDSE